MWSQMNMHHLILFHSEPIPDVAMALGSHFFRYYLVPEIITHACCVVDHNESYCFIIAQVLIYNSPLPHLMNVTTPYQIPFIIYSCDLILFSDICRFSTWQYELKTHFSTLSFYLSLYWEREKSLIWSNFSTFTSEFQRKHVLLFQRRCIFKNEFCILRHKCTIKNRCYGRMLDWLFLNIQQVVFQLYLGWKNVRIALFKRGMLTVTKSMM